VRESEELGVNPHDDEKTVLCKHMMQQHMKEFVRIRNDPILHDINTLKILHDRSMPAVFFTFLFLV